MADGWVSGTDFFAQYEERAIAQQERQRVLRLDAVRRRTENAAPSPSIAHRTLTFAAPMKHRPASFRWHAACSCGWKPRNAWLLRTSAEASANGHLAWVEAEKMRREA
jgi:hypothetical protein